jgi:hypothetical protein
MLWTVHQSFQCAVTVGGECDAAVQKADRSISIKLPGRITVHVYMHGPSFLRNNSSYLSHQRYSILPWFFSTVVAWVISLYLCQFQVLFLLGITVLLSSLFMRGTAWNFQFVFAKKHKSEYSKKFCFFQIKRRLVFFFQNGASMILSPYCTHVLTLGRRSTLCWSIISVTVDDPHLALADYICYNLFFLRPSFGVSGLYML